MRIHSPSHPCGAPIFVRALAFGLLASCATPTNGRPEKGLASPRHLTESERSALADEMRGHGDAMTDLVWAVLYLEHSQVGRIASEIAEPHLGRTREQDDPLRTMFPETYFELERELLARARELADTASTKDANAIASAYGRLAETCVRCHAVYLDDRDTK